MMTHAYFEPYLEDAMRNIAIMCHFCVNEYGMSPEEFSRLFAESALAEQLSKGNPRYLVGLSGKDLAENLLEATGNLKFHSVTNQYEITPEYWAGWVLAYYQWYKGKTFAQMYADGQSFQRVLRMYHPYHEADLMKTVEAM